MSKLFRYISIAVLLLVAVAGIAVWLLVANLDGIVKRVVEEVGTETLATQVTLNSAEVNLADASAALRGLTIANPSGFKSRSAFELGAIEVALAPESISTDVLILETVNIDNASLFFEQIGSKNNLQTLLDNLDSGAASAGEDTEDSSDETLLIIREFKFTDANITMSHDQLDKDLELRLPAIVLRNIGTAEQAVTPEQAARQIIEPILQKATDAARDRAEEEIKARAKQEIDKQKGRAIESARDKLFGK